MIHLGIAAITPKKLGPESISLITTELQAKKIDTQGRTIKQTDW
jgi:hypothetical protein